MKGCAYLKLYVLVIFIILCSSAILVSAVDLNENINSTLQLDSKNKNRDTTYVNISPYSQTVGTGETFTIDIYVDPGEPINGVAFDLSFNASLIHANQVIEGDLFEPYNTFFNGGVIDNNAGTISNVYGFTYPATNTVEDPGIFCTITFTAQSNMGISILHLYDVCVTDINGDCIEDITINDGSVTVGENTPPNITNENPPTGSTGIPISLSSLNVDIVDPDGDLIDWTIQTSPNIGSNSGSGQSGGTKTCPISGLQHSTTYRWYVNATDPSGSGITTERKYIFTTTDESEPPVVNITQPENGYLFINFLGKQHKIVFRPTFLTLIIGKIDIMVDVTDDSGIEWVKFYINDILMDTCTQEPYTYCWDEKTIFFPFTIKVIARDNSGIENFDEINVWKMQLF